ncbi:MAG: hypothetical protein ACLP36_12240 [Acidimicrobiales bacterium]
MHSGPKGRSPFRVADRGRLLESWCDEQVDRRVETLSCVLDADEPGHRVALLARRLEDKPYAATGWAAVAALTGEPPRTGTVVAWVGETVAWDDALAALGATRASGGGSIFLIRAAGDHPLAFRRPNRGVWCVNPIRLYYDLCSSEGAADTTVRQLREVIERA